MEENNAYGKWAQRLSGYLLQYNGEETLKISVWYNDLNGYNNQDVELTVYVNKLAVTKYVVDRSGSHGINVPLNNVTGDTVEISILSNAKLLCESDDRELSVFVVGMGLIKETNLEVALDNNLYKTYGQSPVI